MLPDIKINAMFLCRSLFFRKAISRVRLLKTESNPVRCPDEESAIMEEYIREIRKQGDTVGERLLVLFKMFQLV
jgi:chorismate synthase